MLSGLDECVVERIVGPIVDLYLANHPVHGSAVSAAAEMREAATYGIGGLPADDHLCAKIVALLAAPGTAGDVRGGLVDALHRVLVED